jgi:hypothetical protein
VSSGVDVQCTAKSNPIGPAVNRIHSRRSCMWCSRSIHTLYHFCVYGRIRDPAVWRATAGRRLSPPSDRSPSHLEWSGVSSRGAPLCGGSTVPRMCPSLRLHLIVTSYGPWICTTAAGSCLCYGVALEMSAAGLQGDLQRESGFSANNII